MDPATAAAIGTAASNVLGSVVDLVGGTSDGPDHLRKRTRQANYAAIEGKMQAAKEFGISPLYALGAPTISPAIQTGSSGPTLGERLSSMGQDVSRAVAAGQSETDRTLTNLALDKARLENEYLSAQIASVRTRTLRESAPALPVPSNTPAGHKAVPPQHTGQLRILGMPLTTAPAGSDAQTFEDRWGELGGSLAGLSNIPIDVLYSLYQRWFGNSGAPNKYLNTSIRGGR